MVRLLELINRKFLKDSEFLELEDNDNVISCEYYRPHNAHYKEFLVTINNNGTLFIAELNKFGLRLLRY